jgi:hypothetical protein
MADSELNVAGARIDGVEGRRPGWRPEQVDR